METLTVNSLTAKEIEIPVPWGQISGKEWGSESSFPVVVLHGLLDNCGSFDRLIPLLPGSLRYVCLDLPGHGMSSHFPDGLPLEFFNYVLGVRLAVDHLGLEKFYLMGHSLGAQITLFFSALYPERVVKLICLDGIIPEPSPLEKTVERSRRRLDNIYSCAKGKQPPSYSYEDALHRLLNNRHSQLTEEAARVMIKRSLVPSQSGYRFSADRRALHLWSESILRHIQCFVSSIRSPLLVVLAKGTYYSQNKKIIGMLGKNFEERLAWLIYGIGEIKVVTVEGHHDVHLSHPERVSDHITSFLLHPKSNL